MTVSLGVSVDPWLYKGGVFSAGVAGAMQRSAGPRVVLLQVVEGELTLSWKDVSYWFLSFLSYWFEERQS